MKAKKLVFSLAVLVLLSFILMGAVSGSPDSLPVVKTKTHSVALFKNGLGFFIKSGEVNPKDGWAVIEDIPHAALGSLWLGSLDSDYLIEDVIGFKDFAKVETPAISLEELLKGNIGRKISVLYSGTTITGTLKDFPEDRENKSDDIPPVADYRYGSTYPSPSAASVIIMESQGATVALNKNMIQQVWFPEGYSNTFWMKQKTRKMKLKLDNRKSTSQISMSYLEKGISWMPSYLVDINDSGKARIMLKTEVINDVEDVVNSEFYFVVGFPNFKYSDILSPMSMDQTLVQFIASLNNPNQPSYGAFSNVMRQSVSYGEGFVIPTPGAGYSTGSNLSGAAEEDLFLYQKNNITLKKGERAYYPVFADTVDYEHIYEWKIPDTLQNTPEKEQVWHSIKLTNSTNYPWTTAPAFTVNGTKPLAQDELSYTPKGGKVNVKLTVATDIKADRHETEIDRQRNLSMDNRYYDLVTIQGELKLKNFKTKEAALEITKSLSGDVLESSNNAKVTTVAEGLKSVNKNSILNWNFTLKPGEEITLTYKYKTYIAR